MAMWVISKSIEETTNPEWTLTSPAGLSRWDLGLTYIEEHRNNIGGYIWRLLRGD